MSEFPGAWPCSGSRIISRGVSAIRNLVSVSVHCHTLSYSIITKISNGLCKPGGAQSSLRNKISDVSSRRPKCGADANLGIRHPDIKQARCCNNKLSGALVSREDSILLPRNQGRGNIYQQLRESDEGDGVLNTKIVLTVNTVSTTQRSKHEPPSGHLSGISTYTTRISISNTRHTVTTCAI